MVKRFLKAFLNLVGIRVLLKKNSHVLNRYIKDLEKNYFSIKPEHKMLMIIDRKELDHFRFIERTNSQFGQEILALSINNWKRNGYFVEFGALGGKEHSNTYLLEKEFGWNGIVAECGKKWRESLKQNRNCHIEDRAIWRESGKELTFLACEADGLSTLEQYRSSDLHEKLRSKGETYKVMTITLEDLLIKYDAPSRIDFISIDTEGSEWDILENFPFKNYEIGLITIEHNFNLNREKISNLLKKNGFKQIYSDLSEIEDWFVPLQTSIARDNVIHSRRD